MAAPYWLEVSIHSFISDFKKMYRKKRTENIIWGGLLILLLVPFICGWFPATRGKELFGVNPQKFEWRQLSLNNLRNHQFQNNAESIAKQKLGFCNHAVRLCNEFNYKAFHYSSAPKLILGKQDCFYENIYIDEYTGKDFIGNGIIEQHVIKFKNLRDTLLKQYGKQLVLVLEPGKVRYEPEFLPRGYSKGASTNYDIFVHYLQKHNVSYLDLNQHFKQLKSSTPHPLYSKHGIHWTTYGMWQAQDTLRKFLIQQYGFSIPNIIHVKDVISNQNKDLDFDLEPPMNLLCELPHESLCFPQMVFGDTAELKRPHALIIADSYVWSLWDNGILQHWFSNPKFWYYNQSLYPYIWEPGRKPVDKKRLPETIKQADIILLMMTDANLKDFSWGAVDEILGATR